MRILSVCYEYPPLGGGGAKVVAGLTSELSKAGHKIDLVTMWMPGLPFRERHGNLNVTRIPCIRLNRNICRAWEMPLYLIFAFPVLIFLCIKNRYALNHTHFIFPDGVLAYLLRIFCRLPYAITAHGSDVPNYNPDRFYYAHRLLAPAWRRIVLAADRIICPSRAIETLIHAREPAANTVIIPNGIDISVLTPAERKEDRILVVTRMFERKGIQYLIKALEGFDEPFEVHVVGDGPYLDVIEGDIQEKNLEVKLWGFLENQSEEIKNLYQTSKIFVFPSEAENFPIVLLEAMAAGLAIITTRGTGCAEVVGDAALLVEPRDAVDIRSKLDDLIAAPELIQQLGASARSRLIDKFGWTTVGRQYSTVYSQIVNERN